MLSQKNPNVYKVRCLKTGKITEQHIENIKEKVIMARESELPIQECPEARLPFPKDIQEELQGSRTKEVPEGEEDNEDTSFHLGTQQEENQEESQIQKMSKKKRKKLWNQPRRSARLNKAKD